MPASAGTCPGRSRASLRRANDHPCAGTMLRERLPSPLPEGMFAVFDEEIVHGLAHEILHRTVLIDT